MNKNPSLYLRLELFTTLASKKREEQKKSRYFLEPRASLTV